MGCRLSSDAWRTLVEKIAPGARGAIQNRGDLFVFSNMSADAYLDALPTVERVSIPPNEVLRPDFFSVIDLESSFPVFAMECLSASFSIVIVSDMLKMEVRLALSFFRDAYSTGQPCSGTLIFWCFDIHTSSHIKIIQIVSFLFYIKN